MSAATELPVEVMNALIGPVYDELTEDQALDGMADSIVARQIGDLDRCGWGIQRTDDLEAHMRESAAKDPAFASAYLNAQARTTVRGLLVLIDTFHALDWKRVPNGKDNIWIRRAREIERDANPESGDSDRA